MRVILAIYSGRPNPEWQLTAAETANLVARVNSLYLPVNAAKEQPGKRPRFVVTAESLPGQEPEKITVSGGVVEVNGRLLSDTSGIEALLEQQARQRNFGNALDATRSANKQGETSVNAHTQSQWQWTDTGAQRNFARAFGQFRDELESIWASPNAASEVLAAHARYSSVLQESLQTPELATRLGEAHTSYRQALQQAINTADARDALRKAIHQYLADVVKAFADLPADQLTVSDLMTITQSMTWVTDLAVDTELLE